MRRTKIIVIAVSAVSAPSVVLPPVAHANNFAGATGQSGCGKYNMQDNSTMTYHRTGGLSVGMYNAVAHAINNHVSPTDVNPATEEATPNSNTDVVFSEANYVGSWCGGTWHDTPATDDFVAYAYCSSLSGSKCQRFDVYFDQSYDVLLSTSGRRTLACHEIGHTLGLYHPSTANGGTSDSCVANGSEGYSSHDIKHINDNY
jgi:hypothetical protein